MNMIKRGTITRKVFALLLSLMIVITMMPAMALTAFAEEAEKAEDASLFQKIAQALSGEEDETAETIYVAQIDTNEGTTKYATMADAATAWASNGGTLKLLADVEYGTRINLQAKNDFVLDLNGFTYNAGSGNSPIDVYSALTIKDSGEDKSGKIECDFDKNSWVFVVFVENSATLTMESGTIQGKNGASNDKSGCIYGAEHATIDIIGGKIIDQTTGANGNRWAVEMNGSGTISGGTFEGAVWLSSGGTVTDGYFKGAVYSNEATIKGGYYSQNLAKGNVASEFKWENNTGEDAETYPYKVVPATVTALQGSGTLTDPYQINNLEELKFFRDQVNSGNTYRGKYVALKENIDLNNVPWTPIGVNGSNGSKAFCGTFDGGNHTISNLKVDISSGIAGLFGSTGYSEVTTTIKNLRLTNVDVKGVSNVGGVVGWITGTAAFDNIHISGNVKIEATGADVGGIVGHSVGALTTNNCSVLANENSGSYIKASTSGSAACGGIVGFAGNEASGRIDSITSCSVSNIALTSYNRIGGIVGMMQYADVYSGNTLNVNDNTVSNITVDVYGPSATTLNNRHDAQAGLIVGSTTTNGHRGEHHYANNTYSGNCVLTAVSTHASDIIPTQLYGLWTLGAQRVKDIGQTDSSWYKTEGNANITYASATETGEVFFDGTYYVTFLKAYNTAGIGKTGSSEDKPFKLMTDVGYTLVLGDKIYVESDGHIFYPRTDVDGYHIKTTDISNTVKLYELEANHDAKFVAKLSVNGEEDQLCVSIAAAVSAAPKDGTKSTITVLDNCTIANEITIPTNADITLDLSGKTVEMSDIASKYMFIVKGGLTVQDNTDTAKDGTGTGKLYIHSNTKSIYGLLKVQDGGRIIINSGLLLAESSSSNNIYGLVIGNDNTDNSITANGGKIKVDLGTNTGKNSYTFWGNSGAKGSFTLNGAILEGNSTAQYIIADNSSYGAITLSLIQGIIISHGCSSTKPIDKYADKNSGGTYVGTPLTNILAAGSVIDKPNDTTRVIRKATAVAQIGETKYTTLASAIAEVQDDQTITMLCDVTVDSVIVIPDNKSFTIDLNKTTLSTTAVTGFSINASNLTMRNGTVKNTNNAASEPGLGGKSMETRTKSFFLWKDGTGSLTLDDVKVESTGYSIIVDNNNNGNGAKNKKVTIQDCDITSGKWAAVYAGGADNTNELNITNSTLHSSWTGTTMATLQICMKATLEATTITNDYGAAVSCFENVDLLVKGTENSFSAPKEAIATSGNFRGSKITIEGGMFTSLDDIATYLPGGDAVTINGGTFTGNTAVAVKGGNVTINGGIFTANGTATDPLTGGSSGAKLTGDAIYVEDNYGNTGSNGKFPHKIILNINGGTFTSQNGYALSARFVDNDDTDPAQINIQGGLFKSGTEKTTIYTDNSFEGTITAFAGYYSVAPETRYIASGYKCIDTPESDPNRNAYPYMIGVAPVEPTVADEARTESEKRADVPTGEGVDPGLAEKVVEEVIDKEISRNAAVSAENATNIQSESVDEALRKEIASMLSKSSQLKIEVLSVDTTTKETKTANISPETVTTTTARYDVKPWVTIRTIDTEGHETTVTRVIDNNELEKAGVSINFRLAVPASMKSDSVLVKHYPETEGVPATQPDWSKTYAVQGEGNDRYVALEANSFSVYEIEDVAIQGYVAQNVQTEQIYRDLEEALSDAEEYAMHTKPCTIILLKDLTDDNKVALVEVAPDVTLNLKGHDLEATTAMAWGLVEDSSSTGKLIVKEDHFLYFGGKEVAVSTENVMPVWDTIGGTDGYVFYAVNAIRQWALTNDNNDPKYMFQPKSNDIQSVLGENSGVKVYVDFSYTQTDSQSQTHQKHLTVEFGRSYLTLFLAEPEKLGMYVTLLGTEGVGNVTAKSYLKAEKSNFSIESAEIILQGKTESN